MYWLVNTAWDNNDIPNNSVAIRFNSYNGVVSNVSNSSGYAYGAATTEDEITYGKFYRIRPSAGEHNGNKVAVLCATTIRASASGTTYAYIDVDVTGIDDGLIENDLTIILTAETILPGDIDGDDDVGLADFAELANNWLAGT